MYMYMYFKNSYYWYQKIENIMIDIYSQRIYRYVLFE